MVQLVVCDQGPIKHISPMELVKENQYMMHIYFRVATGQGCPLTSPKNRKAHMYVVMFCGLIVLDLYVSSYLYF